MNCSDQLPVQILSWRKVKSGKRTYSLSEPDRSLYTYVWFPNHNSHRATTLSRHKRGPHCSSEESYYRSNIGKIRRHKHQTHSLEGPFTDFTFKDLKWIWMSDIPFFWTLDVKLFYGFYKTTFNQILNPTFLGRNSLKFFKTKNHISFTQY